MNTDITSSSGLPERTGGENQMAIYQITEDDIERSSTLERSDLGRYYIIVQGCIQFCESLTHAAKLRRMLDEDNRMLDRNKSLRKE